MYEFEWLIGRIDDESRGYWNAQRGSHEDARMNAILSVCTQA
jgi:hypothetical protein